MVSTVGIYESYGGSDASPGSETGDITGVNSRYMTQDSYSLNDTTYPIPIPASAIFYYSFWRHTYLKITAWASTKINNIKWWTDGTIVWTLGTGGMVQVGNRDAGDKGCPMDTEYDVATGTIGTTGDDIADAGAGHGYYNGQTTKVVNATTFNSGAKMTCDSTDHTGTGKCKAVVSQVKVYQDATQGVQATETFTFSYDEI